MLKPVIKANLQKAKIKKKRKNLTKRKIQKLAKFIRSELENSTTHGIPYTVKRELHWFERSFWLAGFVFSAAFILVVVTAQFGRYWAAPTLMSVEKDYFNWNVSFPAITLCPLYKIDEQLQEAFLNEFKLPSTGEDLSQELGPYLEAITSASLHSIHLLQLPRKDILPWINSTDYAKIAIQLFPKFYNTSLVTNTNWPINIEYAMTEMGMCHVINSNVAAFDNPENWGKSDLDGKARGKHSIDLSFHDRDYFVEIVDYDADTYNVYTQSSNDVILSGAPAVPFDVEGFLTFGLQISSTKASPDVKSMSIYRRKCRFVDEPDTTRYPVYSYNRCLLQCRINTIKTLCGCVPHFYRPLEGEKVCNLEELQCLIPYKKELTILSFVNVTVEGTNTFRLPKTSRDCNCLSDCELDYFQKDLLSFLPQEKISKLKIFVATFPKVRILREILFHFEDIVLGSGGVVNLCIGASVISVMEFLMTVIKIPIYRIIQGLNYV